MAGGALEIFGLARSELEGRVAREGTAVGGGERLERGAVLGVEGEGGRGGIGGGLFGETALLPAGGGEVGERAGLELVVEFERVAVEAAGGLHEVFSARDHGGVGERAGLFEHRRG